MAGMIFELFDATKRIENKNGHLDCLLGVNGWGAPTKVIKSKGGPCEQGETAAKTDCIPSTPNRAVRNGRGTPRPINKPKSQLQGLHDSIQRADGGFTVNVLTNTSPKKGFAVSVHPERSFAKPAAELTCLDIARYVMKNRDLLRDPENHLGAWHNPEDGKVYLDVSTVKATKEEAFKLGMEKDQLAGFDLQGGSSFMIDPKATSGGVKSFRRQVKKSKGGPCEQGETAAKSGCIPKGPKSAIGDKPKEEVEEEPGKLFQRLSDKSDDLKTFLNEPMEIAKLRPSSQTKRILEEHSEKTWNTISEKERKAVVFYTDDGAYLVNSKMRQCPPEFECVGGEAKSLMSLVESAVDTAGKLPQPVTVYRGISQLPSYIYDEIHEQMLENLQSGSLFSMPSITSTSLDPEGPTVGGFAGDLVFKIKAKTGLYVEKYSGHKGELELIQSTSSKYKVLAIKDKVEIRTPYSSLPKLKTVFYLEEIVEDE